MSQRHYPLFKMVITVFIWRTFDKFAQTFWLEFIQIQIQGQIKFVRKITLHIK